MQKRGTPPWVWVCLGALLVGALALTGPRTHTELLPRRYTIVVDPTPSMDLPVEGGETRRERALARVGRWLEEEVRAGDVVGWLPGLRAPAAQLPGGAGTAVGLEPPASVQRSLPFAGEPDWRLHDRPGTMIVTDRIPEGLTRAGYAASGGGAVHGTIAIEGRDRVEWDAGGGRVVPGGAPELRLALDPALPEVVRRIVRVWAETRGLTVFSIDPTVEAEGPIVLRVEADAGKGERAEFDLRHEGWTARGGGRGLLPREDEVGPAETWLVVDAVPPGPPAVLVRAPPGRIRIGLDALEEPGGDPARFALSWGRLFDRHSVPPPGVFSLAEREDVGPPGFRAPDEPPPLARPEGEARLVAGEIDAWLAGLAGVLALVAVSLRRS